MTLKEFIFLVPKDQRLKLRKKIAEEIGVSESTVRSWANNNRKPRPDQVKFIVNARCIGGVIKPYDLRPDVFDDELAKKPIHQ